MPLLLGPWLCVLGIHTLVVYLRTNLRQVGPGGSGACGNLQAQAIAELDRMVQRPARLTILLIFDAVGEADFLYSQ